MASPPGRWAVPGVASCSHRLPLLRSVHGPGPAAQKPSWPRLELTPEPPAPLHARSWSHFKCTGAVLCPSPLSSRSPLEVGLCVRCPSTELCQADGGVRNRAFLSDPGPVVRLRGGGAWAGLCRVDGEGQRRRQVSEQESGQGSADGCGEAPEVKAGRKDE